MRINTVRPEAKTHYLPGKRLLIACGVAWGRSTRILENVTCKNCKRTSDWKEAEIQRATSVPMPLKEWEALPR